MTALTLITPTFVAVLCLSLCTLTLGGCLWHAHRTQRKYAAQVSRIEDVLTRVTREVLESGARASRTNMALHHVQDRQDTLECRAAGGQRIESAVRVARQGAASVAVLRDLGLSDAEASLLLRLHTQQNEIAAEQTGALIHDAQVSGSTPSETDAIDCKEDTTAVADSEAPALLGDLDIGIAPHSQAASLARLLASAGCSTATA